MAPELFDKDRIQTLGTEIDVWAFGCLMIEIFSGKRPWGYISSQNTNCIYYEIFKRKPVPIPEELEPALRNLIRACLNYDPKKRFKMDAVLLKLEELYNMHCSSN